MHFGFWSLTFHISKYRLSQKREGVLSFFSLSKGSTEKLKETILRVKSKGKEWWMKRVNAWSPWLFVSEKHGIQLQQIYIRLRIAIAYVVNGYLSMGLIWWQWEALGRTMSLESLYLILASSYLSTPTISSSPLLVWFLYA